MAHCLVIDVEKDEIRGVECIELSDFYRELNCDVFDIARRYLAGKPYDIFCDDVGLFKEDAFVSAFNSEGEPMLVGNLVIANHDGEGNTTSLSHEDVAHILGNCIGRAFCKSRPDGYTVLGNCEYFVKGEGNETIGANGEVQS